MDSLAEQLNLRFPPSLVATADLEAARVQLIHSLEPPAITVVEIIERVAAIRGVTVDALRSQDRAQRISHFRSEAVYLARKLTPLSFPDLGEAFERDHSTIVHAHDLIAKRVNQYPAFRREMEQLERRVMGEVL